MKETLTSQECATYRMVLFVAGQEANSRQARSNIDGICREHLGSVCKLEVVDVLKDYQKALEHRVLITPTLLVLSPSPPVRIVGNLADPGRVLTAMRLPSHE